MVLTERIAAIATVAYADIFGFSLATTEFNQWLIGRKRVSRALLLRSPFVITSRGREAFITLGKKTSLLRQRTIREASSVRKWQLIRQAARLLRLVPTVKLVGVTGGVAVNNARSSDDIDLFLVTQKGTLWISRFLATLILDVTRMRRRPDATVVKDKICLNMFISETALAVPSAERDLYAAHEVLQMKPLWERGGVYRKFLAANRWVHEVLPNAWDYNIKYHPSASFRASPSNIKYPNWFIHPLQLLEPLAKSIQLRYMKRRRTSEVITDTMIRFHPRDARPWVRRELGRRLVRFNIPLTKFFTADKIALTLQDCQGHTIDT